MTRGGPRPGAGRKSDADTPRSKRFEFKLTPAQDWWLDHLATSAGLSRSAVIAGALDRAISAHTCNECDAACAAEQHTAVAHGLPSEFKSSSATKPSSVHASELLLDDVLGCAREIALSGCGILTFTTWEVQARQIISAPHEVATTGFNWRGLTETQLSVLDACVSAGRGLLTADDVIARAVETALRALDVNLDLPRASDVRVTLDEYVESGPPGSLREAIRALLMAMPQRWSRGTGAWRSRGDR